MKLRDEFVTHQLGDKQVLVATGNSSFSGIVRSNATAAFIVNLLTHDTTRENLIDAILQEYDCTAEQAEHAVTYVLDNLRTIGALDE